MKKWALRLSGPLLAAVLAPPIFFLFLDVEPPFERLGEEFGSTIVPTKILPDGTIVSVAQRKLSPLPEKNAPPPKVIMPVDPKERIYVRARYVVTKREPGRVCPGTVQQEFDDRQGNISSRADREARPAKWEQHPTDPTKEVFTGHPVPVPRSLEESRSDHLEDLVIFRSVTFRYCNWLQEWALRSGWMSRPPVIRSGPDLHFQLIKPGSK